jgi:hypothetical protein
VHRNRAWRAAAYVEGTEKNLWSPAKTGYDFEFGESLKPLDALKDCHGHQSHRSQTGDGVDSPEERRRSFPLQCGFSDREHARMTEQTFSSAPL